MPQRRHKLGAILQAMGVVTPEQVKEGLEAQQSNGRKIGETLVELGYATAEQVTEALAHQFQMPFVDLETLEIELEVVQCIPPEIMVENTIFPVERTMSSIVVAMTDPLDLFTMDNLRFILGTEVECVLATRQGVLNAIAHYTGHGEVADKESDEIEEDDVLNIGFNEDEDQESLEDDAPVIKLVTKIIAEAVKQGASDIHIEPMADKLRVRYRIDGMCIEQEEPPKKLEKHIISRLKIMSGMKMQEKRRPQDGGIKMKLGKKHLDFRVSALPATHGESVVLRILDREGSLKELVELGFHESDYKRFEQIIRKPNGIFLVTGPTGSGKTTTLYAALKKLNRPDTKIITAEDPVEYNLPGINQVQVKREIGLTFSHIIRTMLRQAPNIILVGEIRDKETADTAIQAALTGHLVFSTLHTNDAPSALTRLMDLKIPPFLVSSSVLAIMAQRLVRLLCPECREPHDPTDSELMSVGIARDDARDATFYHAVGCPACNGTGYKGRQGVFELIEVSTKLRELVFNKAATRDFREQAILDGMTTLQKDAVRRAMAGQTTIEEVLRVTQREDIGQ